MSRNPTLMSKSKELYSRPGIYPTCTPAGIVLGNKAVILSEDFEKSTAAIFVLHLKDMRWQR